MLNAPDDLFAAYSFKHLNISLATSKFSLLNVLCRSVFCQTVFQIPTCRRVKFLWQKTWRVRSIALLRLVLRWSKMVDGKRNSETFIIFQNCHATTWAGWVIVVKPCRTYFRNSFAPRDFQVARQASNQHKSTNSALRICYAGPSQNNPGWNRWNKIQSKRTGPKYFSLKTLFLTLQAQVEPLEHFFAAPRCGAWRVSPQMAELRPAGGFISSHK